MIGTPPKISWYRSALNKDMLRSLSAKSDWRGGAQTLLHLAVLGLCVAAAVGGQRAGDWLLVIMAVFVFGMTARFSVNGLHELAHGTVFRTAGLNRLFGNLFAFLANVNRPYFWLSPREHHRFSLHPPHDREVEEPELYELGSFLRQGIVSLDFRLSLDPLAEQWRLARGDVRGEWQRHLFALAAERDVSEIRDHARGSLFAHVVVAITGVALDAWMVPVMLLFSRQFGTLPFLLCNSSQHAGLVDRVDDFRLCCRSFHLGWPLRFLYWNMNYHIEHHMYPAVPFHQLPRLHAAIRHDLPHIHRGLLPVWREIFAVVKRQQVDPAFRLRPKLPVAAGVEAGAGAAVAEGPDS